MMCSKLICTRVLPQCETFTLPQARSTVWRLDVSSAPEKPRWVLVGLQADKCGNKERNAAIFYHCSLTSMQVCLNHAIYPSADMAIDFVNEQYVGVYKSFYDIASRYYVTDNLLTGSQVNSVTYKAFYPIHGFDVSKQSDRLTKGIVDLVISDRMLKFKSDGSKMSVLLWNGRSRDGACRW